MVMLEKGWGKAKDWGKEGGRSERGGWVGFVQASDKRPPGRKDNCPEPGSWRAETKLDERWFKSRGNTLRKSTVRNLKISLGVYGLSGGGSRKTKGGVLLLATKNFGKNPQKKGDTREKPCNRGGEKMIYRFL